MKLLRRLRDDWFFESSDPFYRSWMRECICCWALFVALALFGVVELVALLVAR